MKTLGDAIAVAKGVTTGLSLSSDNDLSTSMKEVVQAAAQRLAMPQPLHLEEEITLDVLSDYDAYPAVGLPRGPNLSASVIRMESLEFEAPTTNDLAVSVSILFYNYGIAYRCLSAAIADQPAQSADCTQGALKMFRIAHATMSTFRVDPRETSQFRRMLLVSLLALHHLVEVSQHLGLECNDFSTRLENIQSEVARIVAMEKSLQVHAARAA